MKFHSWMSAGSQVICCLFLCYCEELIIACLAPNPPFIINSSLSFCSKLAKEERVRHTEAAIEDQTQGLARAQRTYQ